MATPKRQTFKSGREDQYMVRFPDGLKDRLKEMAKTNRRSINSEIVYHLEIAAFDPLSPPAIQQRDMPLPQASN